MENCFHGKEASVLSTVLKKLDQLAICECSKHLNNVSKMKEHITERGKGEELNYVCSHNESKPRRWSPNQQVLMKY